MAQAAALACEIGRRKETDNDTKKVWFQLIREAGFLSSSEDVQLTSQGLMAAATDGLFDTETTRLICEAEDSVQAHMMEQEAESEGWFAHEFEVGDLVRINGLKQRPDLNDMEGGLID